MDGRDKPQIFKDTRTSLPMARGGTGRSSVVLVLASRPCLRQALAMGSADFLIVGQGIAGSLVAWRLEQAGARVIVADGDRTGAAGAMAPGLLNPLASRKLRPVWNLATLLPEAEAALAALEANLGQHFFHAVPMLRLLKNAEQADALAQRQTEPNAVAFIGEVFPPGSLGARIRDNFGSFITRRTGWLDIAGLRQALRKRWIAAGVFRPVTVSTDELAFVGDGVRWGSETFRQVIFAEGWRASENPLWQGLPWNPAVGELLELEPTDAAPLLPEPFAAMILNGPQWLVPIGRHRYRAGATYGWEAFEAGPTAARRQEILDTLATFIDRPFRVVAHKAGVRPVIDDYRPVVGPHPRQPAALILNAMGTKGVLHAPWATRCLARYLLDGDPLPAEINVARYAHRLGSPS